MSTEEINKIAENKNEMKNKKSINKNKETAQSLDAERASL